MVEIGLTDLPKTFVALDEFFKQKLAFFGKNKHNWPVCNNQMLKPFSKWDQAFKCTVNERLNTGTNTGPLEKVDEFKIG